MTEVQQISVPLKLQIPITQQYQFYSQKEQSQSNSPITQKSQKSFQEKKKSSFWKRVAQTDSVQPFHQSWLHRVQQEAKIEFMNKLKNQNKGKFNNFFSVPKIITDQNFLQRRKTFETYIKDAYLELLYLQLKKAKGMHSSINQKASYKQVLSQTQNNKLQSQFFMRFKKDRGIIYSNELWSGKYYNRIIEQSRLKQLSDTLHSKKSQGTQEELLYQFEQYFNKKQNIQKIKNVEDLILDINQAFGVNELFPEMQEKQELIQKKQIVKEDSEQLTTTIQGTSGKSLFKLKGFLSGGHQSTNSMITKISNEKDEENTQNEPILNKQQISSVHSNTFNKFQNSFQLNVNENIDQRPVTSPLKSSGNDPMHIAGKYTSQLRFRKKIQTPIKQASVSSSQTQTREKITDLNETSQNKFQTLIRNSRILSTENQQLIKFIENFQKQEELDDKKDQILRKEYFRTQSIRKMLKSNKDIISNSHIRKRLLNQVKHENKQIKQDENVKKF